MSFSRKDIPPPDLELRVRAVPEFGRTRLTYELHSPTGAAPFAHLEISGPVFQGSPEDLHRGLLRQIEQLGEGIDVDGALVLRPEVQRKLDGLGRSLWQQLFNDEMQQAYRRFRESVCTLQITSDEPWIPWEMVKPYDDQEPSLDDEFFAERFELTRWLAGNRPAPGEVAIKALACVAPEGALPQARAERDFVTGLARSQAGLQDASPESPSLQAITALLEKGGIGLFHFIGHGTFDPALPNEAGFPLTDGYVFRPSDLHGPIQRQIAKDRPLVFLNACNSGRQAWSWTRLGGWADRWVRTCGCGAFVGPQWNVRDSIAVAFARAFYESLVQGENLGKAARAARQAARKAAPSNPSWLAYAVYGHPNTRLLFGAEAIDREPKARPVPPEIQRRILDFTPLITRKTEGFVGRQWLFDAIDGFVHNSTSGYVQILGDPGIGKTAIVARLVQLRRNLCHFNVRAEGITKPDQFLSNLCAQLVRDFDLGYSALPPEASRDPQFLKVLLARISTKLLAEGRKVLILVDALDEADPNAVTRGANTLYLPADLPPGIFVGVTSRRGRYKLQFTCEGHTIDLQRETENAKNNFADIRLFTQNYVSRPGIRAYITAQGLDEVVFVDELVKRSEGNFMYLHYVLPEIEKGAYTSRDFTTLPTGLQSYYEDNWARMKELDTQGWFDYKLPVLVALTVAKEPISTELIADFSGVEERARVQMALDEWSQFLEPVPAEDDDGKPQLRYRLYHDSFHDFIGAKDQVKEKGVDLVDANRRIADALWRDLYPEG